MCVYVCVCFPLVSLQLVAVSCPANSSGLTVLTGCACNAGFNGTVVAISSAPYYTSTCQGIY